MRCRGLHTVAKCAYLSCFLFLDLPCVTPYCVPSGVRVVSGVPVAFYFAGSVRPQLAVDLSPLLLSFRGCGNSSPPSALHSQAPSPPHGDEEHAPPGPKPFKVLKAVGNVRKVLQGLLLRESLALVVLETQQLSISGPMANNPLQSKVLYKDRRQQRSREMNKSFSVNLRGLKRFAYKG
jgi:hypothetical protein